METLTLEDNKRPVPLAHWWKLAKVEARTSAVCKRPKREPLTLAQYDKLAKIAQRLCTPYYWLHPTPTTGSVAGMHYVFQMLENTHVYLYFGDHPHTFNAWALCLCPFSFDPLSGSAEDAILVMDALADSLMEKLRLQDKEHGEQCRKLWKEKEAQEALAAK